MYYTTQNIYHSWTFTVSCVIYQLVTPTKNGGTTTTYRRNRSRRLAQTSWILALWPRIMLCKSRSFIRSLRHHPWENKIWPRRSCASSAICLGGPWHNSFAAYESYTAIKDALKKRVCPSKRQQLQQLLHLEELGDRKPSQLLRHMLKLRGGMITEADGIFLQKLPTHIRTVLAIHKAESHGNLADLADNMAEMQGPQQPVQVCAVQQKESSDMSEIRAELKKIWQEIQCQKQGSYSNTSQTSTSKTDLCWYHAKFGSKATKCREPCKFQSGNRPTSQWTQPTRLVSPIYFDFLTQTLDSTFSLTLVRKSVFSLLLELTVYTKLTSPYELRTIQPSTLMALNN